MRPHILLLLPCLILSTSMASAAPPNAAGVRFFENKIRPAMVKYCYECHSEDSEDIEGGLLLDTREATHEGGDRGPAVVPGSLEKSLLIEAIRYENEDMQMPPKKKLPEAVIADFERWIKMGAPDPRKSGKKAGMSSKIDLEAGRKYWAFQTAGDPQPPKVRDREWPKDAIDQFILAKIEEKKLAPAPEADRVAWIRRVSFDLVGLPPTLEEIDAFVADKSSKAKEKVVDRLLASPQFGERWGRHWLDVARYAESTGRTRNYPYPYAWRYRDYVIDALNNDKPYDEFLHEQLAGDLLPVKDDRDRQENLVATGFLALGSYDLNERDRDVFRMDVVNDQIEVTSRALMAMTVGCARCHDHKFDPIPTSNYYAMAGIFRSSELLTGYASRQGGGNRFQAALLHRLGPPSKENDKNEVAEPGTSRKVERLRREFDMARENLKKLKRKESKILANRDPKDKGQQRELADVRKEFAAAARKTRDLKKQIGKAGKKKRYKGAQKKPEGPHANGVRESENIADCKIHIRGDVDTLGAEVPRGFLEVVRTSNNTSIEDEKSGRLELAQWLTDPRHPLTSRVMVNRIWHHLFGRGIVRTVDNFGAMGARPSHPELLDHLATRFVKDGWSIKRLIRAIVLSRTYGLSGTYDEKNYAVDPNNVLLWRSNHRRLQAEAIRDAMLAVSGELKRDRPQGSPAEKLPINEVGRSIRALNSTDNFKLHRSVYQPIVRSFVPGMFVTFDFAEPSEVKGGREITTVAPQALFMMNSEFIRDRSHVAAEKLLEEKKLDDAGRVDRAYRTAIGRLPTDKQRERILGYVKRLSQSKPIDAWANVYHALLASAEFRYVN